MLNLYYFESLLEQHGICYGYKFLQTILFLTDSVLRVLFAYFDESMASIGGYEP